MIDEPKWIMPQLVELLREMDEKQYETDESGGAEIAWYYYRDSIEDLLGLERGTLEYIPPSTEDGD